MADREFKLRNDLALKQCSPLSAAKGSQVVKKDVHDPSNIANACIYSEQAIQRLKQKPLFYLPILNDIVGVISGSVTL